MNGRLEIIFELSIKIVTSKLKTFLENIITQISYKIFYSIVFVSRFTAWILEMKTVGCSLKSSHWVFKTRYLFYIL
jgi:hypothetical protein